MSLDVSAIRAEFPILKELAHGKPLVYLDNAATTQKPQVVIDALVDYYSRYNSNVHRGAHYLSDAATQAFEDARSVVAHFINATEKNEVIWTSGTTEGINRISKSLAHRLQAGDTVVVTELEHHANLVTWQQACLKSGAKLKIAPILDTGELNLDAFVAQLDAQVAVVAFPHVSNALGTINPVKQMIQKIRERSPKALVLVDGAQGVGQGTVDVQDLDCDFYVFSAHKLFGPTGIGVLWGKKAQLEALPVWLTGGEMISTVTYETATWGELPFRLEAGTPNIAGAIGMAAAIQWFQQFNPADVKAHEQSLMQHAIELGQQIPGLKLIGNAPNKVGIYSFILEGGHPADLGFLLDKQGIAIRSGDHCAQPLMARLGVPGTARASFSIYTSMEEVEILFTAIQKAHKMLVA